MKEITMKKFCENLTRFSRQNISKAEYIKKHGLQRKYFSDSFRRFKEHFQNREKTDLYYDIVELYKDTFLSQEEIDKIENKEPSDFAKKTAIIRDDNGSVIRYDFSILSHNRHLKGSLSRQEMEDVYQMYSIDGLNITRRELCRHLKRFTLPQLVDILRAFHISKMSMPFAPHQLEEKSVDDLKIMMLQQKEDNVIRSVQINQGRFIESEYKKLYADHILIKDKLEQLKAISKEFFDSNLKNNNVPQYIKADNNEKIFIINLFDLHIGALVESGSIYNNAYNEGVIYRRLKSVVERIEPYKYDKIIVNLGGDLIDGADNQTARRDHYLPQNMDNKQQVKTFLESMEWFVKSLMNLLNEPKNVFIYSVPCGNHGGILEYAITGSLFNKLTYKYGVQCVLFDEFFGSYTIGDHTFVIMHGKDEKFMKKGFPLILDDNTKIRIYDWLESQNIRNKYIHIIKGDLHNHAITECYKFDYRNCPSIFGASDYSMLNFQRSHHGVAYEILENNQLIRGVFSDI